MITEEPRVILSSYHAECRPRVKSSSNHAQYNTQNPHRKDIARGVVGYLKRLCVAYPMKQRAVKLTRASALVAFACVARVFAEHLYIPEGGQNQLRDKESQITFCEKNSSTDSPHLELIFLLYNRL